MKKITQFILSLVVIQFFFINTIFAQQWDTLGYGGFSDSAALSPTLAVYNGTVYIAYTDLKNGQKNTVMKFDAPNWVPVGPIAFGDSACASPRLAINSLGTPYVTYVDIKKGKKLMCKMFDGSSWVDVGTSTGISTTQILSHDFVIYQDTLYVAYCMFNANRKANVKKFDGTNWVSVGIPDFSPGQTNYLDLEMDTVSGMWHLAFQDGAAGSQASVMKYNGTSWGMVGSAGLSLGNANHVQMEIKNGKPYVICQDNGFSLNAVVYAFNGSTWNAEGQASDNDAFYIDMIFVNDILYAAMTDAAWGYKVICKKQLTSPISWVGSAGFGGVSAGTCFANTAMASGNGKLYLAYIDDSYGGRPVVMELCLDALDLTTTLNGFDITANQANATYQWLDCNNGYAVISGDTMQTFSPSQNGSYACEITNGCAKDTTACVNITGLGVKNIPTDQIEVLPNPTKDILVIDTKENIQLISIYSVNGAVVKTFVNPSKSINVLDLYSGVYILEIVTDKGIYSKQIVKE